MSPHDIALINRWNESKDPDAFAEIVRLYAALVYGACLRVLRNATDAEDVAQECFMKVAEAPVSASTSLSGWLHTMATRKAINKLRGDGRRAVRETSYADFQSEQTEAVWDDVQHLIDEAIANQPDDLRIPVIEHYLRGRTQESIGEEIGISRQAISRRIQKGINSIREDLRKKGLPVAPAIFATGLENSAKLEASQQLHTGLLNSAIGGIDSNTLAHVAATKTTWAISPVALSGIAALVVIGAATTWYTVQSIYNGSLPPSSAPELAAASTSDEDSDAGDSDSIVVAQNEVTTAVLSTGTTVERAPDFTEFGLDRPTPPPGTGAFFVYLDSPKAAGAVVTLIHVNWKPWEKAPAQKLKFTKEIGEDRTAFFRNLPLGEYHFNFRNGNLGVNWPMTVTEDMPGWPVPMNMFPRTDVEFDLRNEAEEAVVATRAFIFQHQLVATPLQSQLTDVWPNPFRENGNIAIDNVVIGGIKAYVEAEGYAPSVTDWIRSRREPVPVLMTQGGSFSCRVVRANGEPVEGVIVHLQGDYFGDRGQAYTNTDGVALIPNLRPVEYRVRVYSEQLVLKDDPPKITVVENSVADLGDVQVVFGTDVEGVVYDSQTGDGIPGVRLSVEADLGVAIEDVVTDASGYYTIPNASFATYRVERHSNLVWGYGAGDHTITFTVTPDSIEGETDFALSTGIPVSGQVVDTDGRPVSGARMWSGNSSGERRRESNSDRLGNFNFNTVREAGEVFVRVEAIGFGRITAGPFDVPEEGTNDLVVELPHGAFVAGNVRIDGKSLPGLTYVWSSPSDPESELAQMGTGMTYTYTGSRQGTYLLAFLSPGTYDLSVQPPGGSTGPVLATVKVREGQLIENFSINYDTSGFELSGIVTDRDGQPVGGADIAAKGQQGSSLRAQSSGDGSFSFVGLGDELYGIEATHGKHSRVQLEGVAAGNDNLRLVMPNHGSVSGQVRSAVTGDNLQRFRIARFAGLLDDIPAQISDGRTISGESGEFRLGDVEIGDTTLIILAEDHAPALVLIPDVREERESNAGRITLRAAAVLKGVVTDVEGNSVQGAFIHRPTVSYGYQGGTQSLAKTDVNGRFEIETLQEGEQSLAISHAEYAPQDFAAVLRFGDETEVSLVVHGGASLTGIVYANNSPMRGAMLTLQRPDGLIGNQSTQSDANGQYLFDKIPAGDYTITAYIPDDQDRVIPSEPFPIAFGNSGTQLLDWNY